MQLIRIGYNHDTDRKFGNLIVVLNQGLKNFSSVSARKLKCPSSAWLGSARNLHSLGSLEPENSSLNSSLLFTYFDASFCHSASQTHSIKLAFLKELKKNCNMYNKHFCYQLNSHDNNHHFCH